MDPQILNVVQVAVAFFFIFFAFFTQAAIEQTVIDSYADRGQISRYAGYYSLAIIYAVFTVANFFAPPIVDKLKAKWSMVAASLFYALFEAGFLVLNEAFLYATSALLGLAAALLWSAEGNYLALNSDEKTAGRNAGIFWAVSQSCQTIGGVFLLIAFEVMGDSHSISDTSTKVLYGVFTAASVVGVVILALLRKPSQWPAKPIQPKKVGVKGPKQTHWQVMVSTLKLATEKPMIFMAVVFAVSGIKLSFKSGIFPTAISFTQRLGANTKTLLAWSTVLGGLGQITAGTIFGILNTRNWIGRSGIVAFGTVVLVGCFGAIYAALPRLSSLQKTDDVGLIEPSTPIILAVSYILGLGDGCWNTQMFTFIVAHYPERSAQGFSIFMFFQSFLTCAAFYYSTLLDLHWHIYILTAGTIAGAICYYIADVVMFRRSPSVVGVEPSLSTKC
ncbi:Ion channel regulatory protein [Aphelenchoides avenae]|nr:Ion channel regulatory protein [Aphelenchus avenae]